MNPKSKRLFARTKTPLSNYAPQKFTNQVVKQNAIDYMLNRFLILRRYSDHKLLKQIVEYQKQKIKAERARLISEQMKLEPWMLTTSCSKLGRSLLGRIRANYASVAFVLFIVFQFYLPVYAIDVTGRVVENGSNYGVPNAQVGLFVNGNITPTITQTNSQGSFSANPLSVKESTPVELNTLEAAIGPSPRATQTLRFNNSKAGMTDIAVYDLATGEEIKKLYSGELSSGTYTIDWDATNNNNERVADGRYGILIVSGLEKKSRKNNYWQKQSCNKRNRIYIEEPRKK